MFDSKKQIVEANFYIRIIATYLDLLLCSFLSQILINKIFLKHITQILVPEIKINFEASSQGEIMSNFLSALSENPKILLVIIFSYILNVIFIGCYFCIFWKNFGATPGKFIMKMKIIDKTNPGKSLTIKQCIKRYLAYSICIFSFFSRFFFTKTKNQEMLQDRIANTLVIKN